MADRGLEIIQKRRDLRNLVDQAAAKQRDLNHINEKIEKDRRELQLLEMTLKVDRAADELNNYPNDLKGDIKTWSIEKLKLLYKDMSNKEIDMLYERIHSA